jgi:nitrous oxide reductase accessory protein NosL
MRKHITWCFVLISAFLFFSAVQAEEQEWCPLCSMNLKMFWKTSHWLTFSDGKTTGYCSIHCASKVYQKRPTEIDLWEVADYHMKTLINAHRAYFLIGSDLPGTMTPVSKLAFASNDVAKSYQKEHGGTIGTLDDALERAIEGRGEDMALIKKKKAKMSAMGKKLAVKHGCYICHGEGGAGGRAVAWNTSEFASSMDSRVKIKKLILGGSHKMEGYQGKITEKELHAITIYVWTQRPK